MFHSRHAVGGASLLNNRGINDVAEHYRGVLDLTDQQMGVFLDSSSGVFFAFFFGLQTQKLVRILEFCSQVKGIRAVSWHLQSRTLTH